MPINHLRNYKDRPQLVGEATQLWKGEPIPFDRDQEDFTNKLMPRVTDCFNRIDSPSAQDSILAKANMSIDLNIPSLPIPCAHEKIPTTMTLDNLSRGGNKQAPESPSMLSKWKDLHSYIHTDIGRQALANTLYAISKDVLNKHAEGQELQSEWTQLIMGRKVTSDDNIRHVTNRTYHCLIKCIEMLYVPARQDPS